MEQILEEQLEETREQLSRLHSIERKLSNRLFQLHYAMTAPLERIERKTFPARPAAFLKKEISQGENLEYPIRELERTSQLPPAMFLGKVGVSISREDLLNSRFHHFSGIFVLLEEEDNYRGEQTLLPEGDYLTILMPEPIRILPPIINGCCPVRGSRGWNAAGIRQKSHGLIPVLRMIRKNM